MSKDKVLSRFRLEVKTLSPLHIGAGSTEELVRDYDFVVRGRELWVMDLDRMLDLVPEGKLKGLLDPKITNLIGEGSYPQCQAYTLALTSVKLPLRVVEQTKDINRRPYLPGSSLKGALRTAVLWSHYEGSLRKQTRTVTDSQGYGKQVEDILWHEPSQGQSRRFDGRRQYAFQPVEDYYLGSEPHQDLLRSLRVTDCFLQGAVHLQACHVVTYSIKKEGKLVPGSHRRGDQEEPLEVWVEAIPANTVLTGELAIEEFLFSPQAQALGFKSKESWVKGQGLVATCWEFSQKLIEAEIDFYGKYGLPGMASIYRRFQQLAQSCKDNEFVLCLSWGAGWRAKTVGTKLAENEVKAVVRKYDLDRRRGFEVFPKTRRLVVTGDPNTPQPAAPLGWVKVILAPA